MSAAASAAIPEEAALNAYVRARAADSLGASEAAVEGYAAALALSPGNEVLASEALSKALAAGDRPLALTAARTLQHAGKMAPDVRLLLLTEALRTRNWRHAGLQIDKIEEDEIFSFMAPVLRAWVAHGSGKGDPIALLNGASEHPLGGLYAAEHRPLMLMARGGRGQGAAELLTSTKAAGTHNERLRIAAAALLARKGDRKEALALLQGDSTPLAAARRQIEAGRRLRGEIATAPAGVAQLLVRIAVDLQGQEIPALALSFARLATFLAPDNSEAWLVTSELLAVDGQHKAALAVLRQIPDGDPFASTAADSRITTLTAADRQEEALAQALAAASAPGAGIEAWARLADLQSQLQRPAEAAQAYGHALGLLTEGADTSRPRWTLLLQQGDALTQAGQWPQAKAALEEAYKLAPDQAVVLNYLGYSQLERRENLDEAERLVREASRLDPDDASITDSLGWALYLRGKLPEAVATLERAAQGQPTDAAINEHLGDAYYSAGRRYEARYAWGAALVFAEGEAMARLRAKIDAGLTPEHAAP